MEEKTNKLRSSQEIQRLVAEEDDIFRKRSGLGCLILVATSLITFGGVAGLIMKGCQQQPKVSQPVKVSSHTQPVYASDQNTLAR